MLSGQRSQASGGPPAPWQMPVGDSQTINASAAAPDRQLSRWAEGGKKQQGAVTSEVVLLRGGAAGAGKESRAGQLDQTAAFRGQKRGEGGQSPRGFLAASLWSADGRAILAFCPQVLKLPLLNGC